MATAPRKQVPGESTTNPQFSAPQVQTAPDIKTSQAVAGNAPAPPIPPQQNVTPAPVPAAKAVTSNTTGAKPGVPTVSSGAAPVAATTTPGATVPTSTGAPPGVPATTPPPPPAVAPPIPPTPKALEGKTAAEDAWIQAQNERDRAVYDAALAYNGGPTSALSEDERKARDSVKSATNARGAAGTINSSLFGEDKGRIAEAKAVADTKAYDTYQKAQREANDLQEKALIVFHEAGEREKREMEEAARRVQPTQPMTPPPVNAGGEKTILGPAGPGGVVPYVETLPGGGSVHVGPPLRKR